MARPAKPELDYSAIDCNFSRKSLSLKIRRKFGLEGLAVLYEVIVWINGEKGCYVECESVSEAAEMFATTRLFDLNRCEWVEEVFSFMLEIGFFDPKAFVADKVLTSEGITRRWYNAKKQNWEFKNRSCPYLLPPSVLAYLNGLEEENQSLESSKLENLPPNCHKAKQSKAKALVPPLTPPAGGNAGEEEKPSDLPEDGLPEPEREVILAWNQTFPAGDPRHLAGPPYPVNGFFAPNLHQSLASGLTTQQIVEAFCILRDSDHAWQLHSAVKADNVRMLLTEKQSKRTRAAPKEETTRYTDPEVYRNYTVRPALAGDTV